VNAIDLAGADAAAATDLEIAAADNVKRVLRPSEDGTGSWAEVPDTRRLRAYLETKTVWHPVGT
jgi:hypothetical protein